MDRAIDFIRETDPTQSFCLSLSTWAPHANDSEKEQYYWPSSCDDLYRDGEIPPPVLGDPSFFDSLPAFVKKSMNRKRWFWRFDTPAKYQKMVKGYYRMISGVDMALGRLLDELKLLDRHKDTIIIFMGDNGYFLGERGFAGKWTMHDLSIRVPLIIHDPKLASARKGTVDSSLVLNIDIAPTILDMAGLSIPQGIQGRSLVPILNGSIANPRKEILTEHLWDHPEIPQTEAVRTQQWKYIRYPQHLEFEELYDLRCDPIEKNNFFRDKRYSEVRAKLSRILDQLIQKVS